MSDEKEKTYLLEFTNYLNALRVACMKGVAGEFRYSRRGKSVIEQYLFIRFNEKTNITGSGSCDSIIFDDVDGDEK